MVLRRIETSIPTIDDLSLPEVLKKLAMTKRGLVLFVGGTGSGKSTSLAAMIDYRNRNSSGHIITIEDPIEYVHQHQNCIVTQREVGMDTAVFDVALKNTLRQAPDVILIGEIRDPRDHGARRGLRRNRAPVPWPPCTPTTPTRRWTASSTSSRPIGRTRCGWTCRSTSRPSSLSNWCRAPDGKGRRAVIEVLINTPLAADLIRKGEVHELKGLMKRSTEQGMQTFDQALYNLYTQGEITYEDALLYADSANDLRLMIKLGSETDGDHLTSMAQGLALEVSEEDPGRRFR